jgi:rRNA biogenesis protein RRP5
MKASHFIGDEDSDDVSSVGDDEDAEMVELNGKNEEIEEDSSEGDDDGLDSDDDKYVSKLASKLNAETGDNTDDDEDVHDNSPDSGETDEDDSDEDDSEHGDSEGKKDEGSKKAMDSNVGFQWGPEPVHDQNDDDVSDDDDGEEGEDGEKPKPHSSRKKAAARRLEEEQIRQREKALASDADPETAEDFERLLASQPNNSEQWIRYMAYFLSLADMDGCRTVAKRALARIDFRQEGEKLNIWTALLTMELKYGGGSKMFNDTLENACKHNNPKHIYLRACELLEKEIDNAGSTHQAIERADELYNKMCKKFRSKKKVWLAHLAYLVKRCGRHQEAHALLKRALASLPSYKHVEVMSKLAQLEFEFGSPERGRTVFDGILSKYPKRLDLLFVYVDKEVKAADGNMKTARQLLRSTAENPLTKLSDKQMKKLFRKWMKLEEDHGDENSREAVKDAARSYVARTSGSKS